MVLVYLVNEDTNFQRCTLVSDKVHVLLHLAQAALCLLQVTTQQLLSSRYGVLQHHIGLGEEVWMSLSVQ